MTTLSDKVGESTSDGRTLSAAGTAAATDGAGAAVKRTLDILIAACLLVLIAPALALVALAITLDSPGPILFRQVRTGRNGATFVFLKFRSMIADAELRRKDVEALNEADGPLFKIRNDPRITRVGRFLRRTSLDELPQLWNVLRGEMSLVGPRPPLPSEVVQYEAWQHQRLLVRPGITGLWQVSGRSNVSFTEMVQLDLQYIQRWSLWLDVCIMVRTLLVVFLADGAY